MLKKKGVQEEIFNELKYKNKMQFEYKDKSKVVDFVSNIANSMSLYPLEDLMVSEFSPMEEFKKDELQKILDALVLENGNIVLRS